MGLGDFHFEKFGLNNIFKKFIVNKEVLIFLIPNVHKECLLKFSLSINF